MRIRTLILALALAAVALPASAVVKVYNSTPPGGQGGDQIQFTTTLCPPIQTSANYIQGSHKISDTGSGTVTLVEMNIRRLVDTNFGVEQLTPVFGPGSYVFVSSDSTQTPSLGTTHAGSTAPTGTVDWGVISGWSRTGLSFCISSPQTICTGGAQTPHGITTPVPNANSPTYDLGTWAFDAEGDFAALAPFINQTNNGGTSNIQFLVRGSFVGGSIPALPLVGAGALAIGLIVVGARTALRKR